MIFICLYVCLCIYLNINIHILIHYKYESFYQFLKFEDAHKLQVERGIISVMFTGNKNKLDSY